MVMSRGESPAFLLDAAKGVHIRIVKGHALYNIFLSKLFGATVPSCTSPQMTPWL